MFGFFKKKPIPHLCRANPGVGTEAKVAFSTGERSWTEHVDAVALAAEAFHRQGHTVSKEKAWLEHPVTGFQIQPQLVEIQPLDNGGVRTVTTMQTNHAALAPAGVFEYQHSTGDTVADSVRKQWLQTDFVPLREALRPKPESCTMLEMSFPEGKSEKVRRAILGPVAHYRQNPAKYEPEADASEEEEDHGFCPCCLLTKSLETFVDFLKGDGLFCLRLFALRDAEGASQADCRVNGEDFEPGAEALRAYASTWPDAGYEFRKQYVVLYTAREAK